MEAIRVSDHIVLVIEQRLLLRRDSVRLHFQLHEQPVVLGQALRLFAYSLIPAYAVIDLPAELLHAEIILLAGDLNTAVVFVPVFRIVPQLNL